MPMYHEKKKKKKQVERNTREKKMNGIKQTLSKHLGGKRKVNQE